MLPKQKKQGDWLCWQWLSVHKSEHWKHVYSMCPISNAGWLLVVQGKRGWHHRERRPSSCPWPISTFHDRSQYAQKLHAPTLVGKKTRWPKNLQKAEQLCFIAFFYNLQYTVIKVGCCQQVARLQEERWIKKMTPSQVLLRVWFAVHRYSWAYTSSQGFTSVV